MRLLPLPHTSAWVEYHVINDRIRRSGIHSANEPEVSALRLAVIGKRVCRHFQPLSCRLRLSSVLKDFR